jgi:hypothetical protein
MDDDWDRTTESINSESSDELYNTRPNRWRGAKSTWRDRNREERAVYDGLEALRRSDLAVHLYNAFALKNGPRRKIGPNGELVSVFLLPLLAGERKKKRENAILLT